MSERQEVTPKRGTMSWVMRGKVPRDDAVLLTTSDRS